MRSNKSNRIAIGYGRVSSDKQVAGGVSLEVQHQKFQDWCRLHEYAYDPSNWFFDAGISGKSTANRPALHDAIEKVCACKGLLFFYSLSRFGRNLRETIDSAHQLQEAGCDMISYTEAFDTSTSTGRMVFVMLSAVAEKLREDICENTKNSMAHLRSIGRKTSRHAPYGTRHEPCGFKQNTNPPQPIFTCVPDPQEQITIRVAQSIRAPGTTLRDIANALDYLGLRNRAGKKFAPSVIASMFRSADEQQQKSA